MTQIDVVALSFAAVFTAVMIADRIRILRGHGKYEAARNRAKRKRGKG